MTATYPLVNISMRAAVKSTKHPDEVSFTSFQSVATVRIPDELARLFLYELTRWTRSSESIWSCCNKEKQGYRKKPVETGPARDGEGE